MAKINIIQFKFTSKENLRNLNTVCKVKNKIFKLNFKGAS